jgi:hypothetical protein
MIYSYSSCTVLKPLSLPFSYFNVASCILHIRLRPNRHSVQNVSLLKMDWIRGISNLLFMPVECSWFWLLYIYKINKYIYIYLWPFSDCLPLVSAWSLKIPRGHGNPPGKTPVNNSEIYSNIWHKMAVCGLQNGAGFAACCIPSNRMKRLTLSIYVPVYLQSL